MSALTEPQAASVERLAFTVKETCQTLGISRTALWRLEKRGLIKPSRAFRTRLYPRAELLRFLEETK